MELVREVDLGGDAPFNYPQQRGLRELQGGAMQCLEGAGMSHGKGMHRQCFIDNGLVYSEFGARNSFPSIGGAMQKIIKKHWSKPNFSSVLVGERSSTLLNSDMYQCFKYIFTMACKFVWSKETLQREIFKNLPEERTL